MNQHGIEYFPHQVLGRDGANAQFAAGVDSTLVVMPTGTGKTVLAGMMVEDAVERELGSTLFIAHREILVDQAMKTMLRFGHETAVEMGLNDARRHVATMGMPDVVVGSIQSLQSDRLMRWNPKTFKRIIIDECHRAHADMYTKTLNWFQDYQLLGITATPKRGDQKNLGARFQTKAYEYRLRDAISEGFLVPIITRTCQVSVNLRGVKLAGGDFAVGDLEERIGPKLELLARGFLKQIGKRPAVAFLPDVGSAMAFAQILTDIGEKEGTGIKARYVAGTGGKFGMTKAERKANLDAYNAGEYQIIVCNELLVEGWDCPRVEAVGIFRVTLQQYRYSQMVGRGTRVSKATGKTDLLVVDADWETDEEHKDLCTTVDLFDDGSIDMDVFAVARQLAGERAVDVNPLEVLEEAEKIVRVRQKFRIKLTGKEEEFRVIERNPVGVSQLLGIKLNRKHDLDKNGVNPATDRQCGMLKGLGVVAPEGLSKWGASKMIDKLAKRRDALMARPEVVQNLLIAGISMDVATQMKGSEAVAVLNEIRSHTTQTQRRLFT